VNGNTSAVTDPRGLRVNANIEELTLDGEGLWLHLKWENGVVHNVYYPHDNSLTQAINRRVQKAVAAYLNVASRDVIRVFEVQPNEETED
jgi:hypothetical protein